MVQARGLGDELYVGVHSDEAILENKGPTVMTLQERWLPPPPGSCVRCASRLTGRSVAAIDACRWVTQSVPHAPYVTQLDWISHFGCKYVVHGDDVTSDSAGEDCYRFVKAAGRFKVVRRTPSISTTDLVGRMLLCTKTHFIRSLEQVLAGSEGPGTAAERAAVAGEMAERVRLYATDETARRPGADVWFWSASARAKTDDSAEEKGDFHALCEGPRPRVGQRVVYVDGGFDLFSSGHVEFLRLVAAAEDALARADGWYAPQAVDERAGKGADYPPAFVVVGVHDDEVINYWKGINYPIMNIYERGLCVLQCRVSEPLCQLPAATCVVDAAAAAVLLCLLPGHASLTCACCPVAPVRQRRRVRRALHANQGLPDVAAVGHARRRVPRPDVVHAPDLRPLHGAQGHGHLPRDRPPRVRARQRRHHRAAHPEEPRHVRGAPEGQGHEGQRRGGPQEARDARGGAAAQGGREGGVASRPRKGGHWWDTRTHAWATYWLVPVELDVPASLAAVWAWIASSRTDGPAGGGVRASVHTYYTEYCCRALG